MAGKRAWELEHGFFAYFHAKDASQTKSLRDIAADIKRDYGKEFTAPTIGNMVAAVGEMLATDAAVKDGYERFKAEMKQSKYFYRFNSEGKIESPYESVRRKCEQVFAKKGYYSRHVKQSLRVAEKFWQFVGRKKPDDWTEDDLNGYLATLSQGKKFAATVSVRAFSKELRDIDNATQGLKGLPRMPAVLKVKEFPQIFKQLVEKTLEMTPIDQKADMEFILRVKPATGIRTGERETNKGLWGTKIGAPYKNKYGKNGSNVQVVGKTLLWHVLEKMDEEWDINFLTDDLRAYIANFVQRRASEGRKFLIEGLTDMQANRIFGDACEAIGIERLELHDMRKIYVSFLVRAGIPLEKAISLNVGWKDIATAYKHYLALADLGEKEEEYKRKMGAMLHQGGVA